MFLLGWFFVVGWVGVGLVWAEAIDIPSYENLPPEVYKYNFNPGESL